VDQVGAAAVDLLASSTLARYERCARVHARATGLVGQVHDDQALPTILDCARQLWAVARAEEERGVAEIELAIVLVALEIGVTDGRVRTLMEQLAAATGSVPSGWLPALARRLLARHAPRREQRDRKWTGGSRGSHRELQETPCT
jgi:hypothetical protein